VVLCLTNQPGPFASSTRSDSRSTVAGGWATVYRQVAGAALSRLALQVASGGSRRGLSITSTEGLRMATRPDQQLPFSSGGNCPRFPQFRAIQSEPARSRLNSQVADKGASMAWSSMRIERRLSATIAAEQNVPA